MARPSPEAKPARTSSLALFDSATLIGKGVKGHLARRRFPVSRMQVFDTGAMEEGGNITEFDGAAMLATRPDFSAMEQIDLAFFCGPDGSAGEYLDWTQRGGFTAIDLSLTANRRKGIPVVNAWVNPQAARRHEGLLAAPHPASLILSTLLAPMLRIAPLRDVTSIVFQPASEKGEEGIEDLYRQTVGVLNFTEFPKERFGRILAFNLFPSALGKAYFPDEILAREVAFILGGAGFPHAVASLAVPVFHGHSFLCRVSFAVSVSSETLHAALAGQEGLRLLEGTGAISAAELAGQEGVQITEIRRDASLPDAFWVWGVSDNLVAGTALNAVRLAEELLEHGALPARRSP